MRATAIIWWKKEWALIAAAPDAQYPPPPTEERARAGGRAAGAEDMSCLGMWRMLCRSKLTDGVGEEQKKLEGQRPGNNRPAAAATAPEARPQRSREPTF
ncbi:unnamed protein product [Gongylonema pulchrum]|uniref:Uncharacterized protein n=1 Tax=Gongylonema pulchrum TaxID=637853 RepID=A0A183DNU7_9BILA|nr:unnamed protein product [Gongylonema pulchrum]